MPNEINKELLVLSERDKEYSQVERKSKRGFSAIVFLSVLLFFVYSILYRESSDMLPTLILTAIIALFIIDVYYAFYLPRQTCVDKDDPNREVQNLIELTLSEFHLLFPYCNRKNHDTHTYLQKETR